MHPRLLAVALALLAVPALAWGPPSSKGPHFEDVLNLPGVGSPRISPDGAAVVFTVRQPDWDENRYDTELWLARRGEEAFPLTRTPESSSTHPRWSPDGRRIAFLADRGEDKQVYLIRAAGGEARPLTAVDGGIEGFEWSPDGTLMVVAMKCGRVQEQEDIEELYGRFAVEDSRYERTHLWILDATAALERDEAAEIDGDGVSLYRRLTSGSTFTVRDYEWSPDGRFLAISHTPDPRMESWATRDISLVEVKNGRLRPLVERPGFDGDPVWSPDGQWVLFATGHGTEAYYRNLELARVRARGGEPVLLTESFDENPSPVAWLEDGIRFTALDRTHRRLYHLDPAGGEPRAVGSLPRFVSAPHFSRDGHGFTFTGESPEALEEVYRVDPGSSAPERLTRLSERTMGWPLGTREVVQWTSRDGAIVEGVLLKPEDFDPGRRHPLMVVIHGGPNSISLPLRVYGSVYPVEQWLARGAVVLMPNYRGSAGYGEAFRSLNVRNLGVGDAWDVLSGVDSLVDQGFIDTDRMAAMGWSQGGYISAFLTTTTKRFQAISVGAGISNWMTYYVNTDIHPFTRHYLEATPWDDPDVYARTSPMTYIKDAQTPTLIQHGEFDRRVPVPNAYELYQGLQDVGVETRLIIYKDFGHGITRPKERLAALWHNWQWFARHIWDEEVELPLGSSDEDAFSLW